MILILSGGVHKDSMNKKLAQHVEKICHQLNTPAEFIDISAYDLPLLDPSNKSAQKPPKNLLELREKFERANGFYISIPEYNGGITPILSNLLNSVFNFVYFPKNTMAPIINKPALVGSASPSIYGALQACMTLKSQLSHMGAIICPHAVSLSKANDMFDNEGNLSNAEAEKRLMQGVNVLLKLSNMVF